jgi:uncharacterized protein YciI
MKNMEANYNQPHHVMLIFQHNTLPSPDNECIINDRCQYYQKLKEESKLLFCGNFWNQGRSFTILHINSAAEFEYIIDNDPGLKHGLVELERAMPFTHEQNLQPASEW